MSPEVIAIIVNVVLSVVALGIAIWALVESKRAPFQQHRVSAMKDAELSIRCALGKAGYSKWEESLSFISQASDNLNLVNEDTRVLVEAAERCIRAWKSAEHNNDRDSVDSMHMECQRLYAEHERIFTDYWGN